jgi:pimeloyl-ACP methyl ester carboxylesterase
MPRTKPPAASKNRPPNRNGAPTTFEVVDPVWLAKAIGITVAAALVCVYATLCLLVYQGEWQLVLHPSHAIGRTPASEGLAYTDVHFGAADTGQPRLTGWWVPAQSAAPTGAEPALQTMPKYGAYTVLYLHDGSGSLADTVPMAVRLHRAGLNVFAIDYRGFGASDASVHPSAARMAEDAAAALDYLTATRHIPARNVIPYGAGLGAALAANLALAHPELPAVIVDNPDPDPAGTAVAAYGSHFIPVRLLFGEQFDSAAPIASLKTPKLLIAGGPSTTDATRPLSRMQSLFQHAASPRFTVTLPPGNYEVGYQTVLSRFLDQYLPAQ